MDSSGVTGDSCSTKTEDHMAYVYWEHNMRIYIYTYAFIKNKSPQTYREVENIVIKITIIINY